MKPGTNRAGNRRFQRNPRPDGNSPTLTSDSHQNNTTEKRWHKAQ